MFTIRVLWLAQVRRELHTTKEAKLKLAAKMTKLETALYVAKK